MKIFISGGSGMVGRNLLEQLQNKNFDIDAPSSKTLNLLKKEDVSNYLKGKKFDFVIHCAGKVGGIQANMKDPFNFLYENLEMGKNLVLAAKENNIQNFLNIGSSCIYPRNYSEPIKESHLMTGELEPTNEGYALAKITVLKLCQYLNESTNLSYKTIIPCNLYGKYDNFSEERSHLVPAIIRKVIEAKEKGLDKIVVWGDGNARREFMYTKDFASFIEYSILNFDKIPNILNVGLESDFTINQYYNEVCAILGFEGVLEHDLTKPVGMLRKKVDTSLLSETDWKPSYSLKQGLSETIDFYRSIK
ncbi:GDP-L-fucose synthase family protein [Bacteriovorax sp. BSW11_IV]|uniref:GDP-L-fucose synthase family protein n=1 Tax=Bacteriovorax sp. BSW11_IV TaxID=1353529 RepID=UPI0004218C28|nr:GDP-L-fucose synthase [Bacteriovorax sp. BSW11_IV]